MSAVRDRAWRLRQRWRSARLVWRSVADLTAPPAHAFAAFGRGSVIVPPARVEHPENISIGDSVVIHEHAWLIASGTAHEQPRLRIDDGARLSRFVKIECHGSVHIGAGVLIADRTFICDVEHLPGDGDVPPADRLTPPRPIHIEDGAFIGAGAVIKPGVTIGRHAYVSASSVVVDDVAERTLVTGAPARAIRQWSASEGPPTDA
jgi:acetyltransferase-like isoleucine patch superfamily enzyme